MKDKIYYFEDYEDDWIFYAINMNCDIFIFRNRNQCSKKWEFVEKYTHFWWYLHKNICLNSKSIFLSENELSKLKIPFLDQELNQKYLPIKKEEYFKDKNKELENHSGDNIKFILNLREETKLLYGK